MTTFKPIWLAGSQRSRRVTLQIAAFVLDDAICVVRLAGDVRLINNVDRLFENYYGILDCLSATHPLAVAMSAPRTNCSQACPKSIVKRSTAQGRVHEGLSTSRRTIGRMLGPHDRMDGEYVLHTVRKSRISNATRHQRCWSPPTFQEVKGQVLLEYRLEFSASRRSCDQSAGRC